MALVSFISSQPNDGVSLTAPQSNDQNGPTEENVCRTEVCKRRANIIKDYLDNDTDPCDDFYGYVCKKWINNHTTNGSYDAFQMLQQQFLDDLTDILQSTNSTHSPQEVTDKPAILYKACMNFTGESESSDILKIMNNSNFKEWPLSTQATGETDIFNNASAVLSHVGMIPLIQYYVSRNYSTHVIMILPLGIADVPEKHHIEKAVQFVKPDIDETYLNNFTGALQNLRKQWLAEAPEKKMRTLAPPVATTIESLERNFSNIPLYDLLNKEFSKVPNLNVKKEEKISVYNLEFYEAINKFLDIAKPEELYNYIGLQSVLYWFSRSPLRAEDEQRRPERCVGSVYSAMKEVVTDLYAQKYFPAMAKMEVETIVEKIKDAYEEAINNTKWMDDTAKGTARIMLKRLTGKIGYPMWALNITVLQKLYEYVPDLYPNMSFFDMMQEIDDNRERKRVGKLRQAYDPYMEWFSSPSPVNAYFNVWGNEFVYPVGGLQPPFFEHGLPWSLNFGGIGVVIAHEITHAFARGSRKYPTMTYLKNETKVKEFDKTVECFQHQYGNITDNETNITLNGLKTLDENIADNNGLQMALNAYQKLVMDDCGNTTTSLDGLADMSSMQLFFVGFAMPWCSAISEKDLMYKIANDSHSPNKHRVNVPLQNSDVFATTFNCSRQPTHRCTLW